MPGTGKEKPIIRVRKFRKRDAPAVSLLIRSGKVEENMEKYGEPRLSDLKNYALPEWIAARAHSKAQRFVLTVDDEVLGTGSYEKDASHPTHAELFGLRVAKKHRNEGLGRTLVAHIEESAKNDGVQMMRLQSVLSAIDFYLKLGYGGAHVRFDKTLGALTWMRKKLVKE